MTASGIKKVTISMSGELLAFADQMAAKTGLTRSRFISSVLRDVREREEARLAAEGYRFFAAEAEEFATASGAAVAEAMPEGYDGDSQG